jgi:hypothetical protein
MDEVRSKWGAESRFYVTYIHQENDSVLLLAKRWPRNFTLHLHMSNTLLLFIPQRKSYCTFEKPLQLTNSETLFRKKLTHWRNKKQLSHEPVSKEISNYTRKIISVPVLHRNEFCSLCKRIQVGSVRPQFYLPNHPNDSEKIEHQMLPLKAVHEFNFGTYRFTAIPTLQDDQSHSTLKLIIVMSQGVSRRGCGVGDKTGT